MHDAESENGILKAATACPPSAHLLKLLHAFLGKGKKKGRCSGATEGENDELGMSRRHSLASSKATNAGQSSTSGTHNRLRDRVLPQLSKRKFQLFNTATTDLSIHILGG